MQAREKRPPSLIDLNNYIYSAAVSVNQYLGQLIENKERNPKKQPILPKWLSHLQESINRTRKDIAHIMTINECRIKNQYTKKQIKLKDRLRKKFGNIKQTTLDYKLILLKHDLKAKAEKMKHHRNMIETKRLNRKFACDPKSVYRSMKGNTIEVKDMPTKDDIQAFWKSIWNEKIDYNTNAPWINELKTSYCANVEQKDYKINLETLKKALSKIQNNKSPGRDMIIGFWYKKLQFYRPYLMSLFQETPSEEYDFPAEIVLAKTVLIPTNVKYKTL